MKKAILAAFSLGLFAAGAQAQYVRRNIEKAMNHPMRKENAAKADVWVISKKKMVHAGSEPKTKEYAPKKDD